MRALTNLYMMTMTLKVTNWSTDSRKVLNLDGKLSGHENLCDLNSYDVIAARYDWSKLYQL